MNPTNFFLDLYRRNRLLIITGWVHLALLAVLLHLLPFDTQMLAGIRSWIAPAKLAFSTAAFVGSIVGTLDFFPAKAVRTFVSGVVAALGIIAETLLMIGQVLRGSMPCRRFQ